mmetsp:Transcript_81788/g.227733  ORF Transcript_81788/g.227733 Transcript_81788/m.227733 type:complete len:310 (-) Transcript_81788:848-1777(-)
MTAPLPSVLVPLALLLLLWEWRQPPADASTERSSGEPTQVCVMRTSSAASLPHRRRTWRGGRGRRIHTVPLRAGIHERGSPGSWGWCVEANHFCLDENLRLHPSMPRVVSGGCTMRVTGLNDLLAHTTREPDEHLPETSPAREVQSRLLLHVHHVHVRPMEKKHLADRPNGRKKKRCLAMTVRLVGVGFELQKHPAKLSLAIERRCVQHPDALFVAFVRVRSRLEHHASHVDPMRMHSGPQRRARALPTVRRYATLECPFHGRQRRTLLLCRATWLEQRQSQIVEVPRWLGALARPTPPCRPDRGPPRW